MTSKSDAPALRMTVERGPRLSPATAFDAERLDSYKIGRTIKLQPVDEADRKDIRRWWAILQRAIKDTKTPWRTATQASEAIKLALGIVNYGKSVNGTFIQWPRSLKELDDAELEEAVRDMAALLHKITGVDPMEWSKETADVGRDEQESQEASPPPEVTGDGSEDDERPPVEPAPEESAAADQEGDAGAEAASSSAPARDPKIVLNLKAEAVDKFLQVATNAELDVRQRRDVLEKTKQAWKQELRECPDFVKACLVTADKVIKSQMPIAEAREYLSRLVR